MDLIEFHIPSNKYIIHKKGVLNLFITLEGPEGSGKTSHIPYLVEYLREKGYTIFPTREPGGTRLGESLAALRQRHRRRLVGGRTLVLLISDGLANAGITSQFEIRKKVQAFKDNDGITLSTFGSP